MTSLLIPGQQCPRKDFDVFLEPLIDEQEFSKGVPTFDALSGKKFGLHGVVIWCIYDYPGLGTLSWRKKKDFDGQIKTLDTPEEFSIEELM
jgi:hypothetical protein